MLWMLIRIASPSKIITKLSSNMHLISSAVERRGDVLFNQQTAKALVRLCRYRFSNNEAQLENPI